MSSRLKAAQDDRDRASRDRASLRDMMDALRVELAEALVLAAGKTINGDEGGVFVGGDWGVRTVAPREGKVTGGSVAEGGAEGAMEAVGAGYGDEGSVEVGDPGAGSAEGIGKKLEISSEKGAEPDTEKRGDAQRDDGLGGGGGGGSSAVAAAAAVVVEGRREEAENICGDSGVDGGGGGGGDAAAARLRGRWPDDGFEGTIGESSRAESVHRGIRFC